MTPPKKRNVGRPRSPDPRVSTNVSMSRAERTLCNRKAKELGLPFAIWARKTLLLAAKQKELFT